MLKGRFVLAVSASRWSLELEWSERCFIWSKNAKVNDPQLPEGVVSLPLRIEMRGMSRRRCRAEKKKAVA